MWIHYEDDECYTPYRLVEMKSDEEEDEARRAHERQERERIRRPLRCHRLHHGQCALKEPLNAILSDRSWAQMFEQVHQLIAERDQLKEKLETAAADVQRLQQENSELRTFVGS